MQKTILSFGEALWDLFPTGAVLGGAPLNFAYRINSLGHRGIIATRLGADELGDQAHRQISDLGMETGFIQRDPRHATGTVRVTVDAQGNPDFTIVPGVAYDFIEPTEALRDLTATCACFCFGTVAQRADRSRQTLHALLDGTAATIRLLDLNLRKDCFTEEIVEQALFQASVLKLNLQEADQLMNLVQVYRSSLPDFCAAISAEFGLDCMVVTLGEHGAFAASQDGEKVYVPGYKVPVVDSCGSGDAFSAGFIHELLREASLAQCCVTGNALGAIVATQKGATTPVPSEQLRDFLQAKHERIVDPRLMKFSEQ